MLSTSATLHSSLQAFGAEKYQLIGECCQHAGWILSIVGIPICITWWHGKEILLWAGQDEEVSHLAGQPFPCFGITVFCYETYKLHYRIV